MPCIGRNILVCLGLWNAMREVGRMEEDHPVNIHDCIHLQHEIDMPKSSQSKKQPSLVGKKLVIGLISMMYFLNDCESSLQKLNASSTSQFKIF